LCPAIARGSGVASNANAMPMEAHSFLAPGLPASGPDAWYNLSPGPVFVWANCYLSGKQPSSPPDTSSGTRSTKAERGSTLMGA
jgi:hypothetical protein